MTFIAIMFYLQSLWAQESNTWTFKSSIDTYTVTASEGKISIGETAVNRKVFDSLLKTVLKPNRADCPSLGAPELTVEARSGSTTVIKKFHPVAGVVESNGKCGDLDYDTGWTLPFHREWLIASSEGSIAVGTSMNFKSNELSFQVSKKENEWSTTGTGFIPDLMRITQFSQALSQFDIEKRYSKKIKSNATHNFTLSTGGYTYRFYLLEGLWSIELPNSASLVATRDFSMIGKFTAGELKDNRASDLAVLADKSTPANERVEVLEKMADVDTPIFKSTLLKILKDSTDSSDLRYRVSLVIVGRPSKENVRTLMSMLENGGIGDKAIASRALVKLNPIGPVVADDDDAEQVAEKVKKWKEWYAKYLKAQK